MAADLSRMIEDYEANPDSEDHYIALINYAKEKIGVKEEKEQHLYVKALADAARSETGRKVIVDSDIVNHVSESDWCVEDDQYFVQICRLGGNLCFDNPSGRSCVLQSGILDKLAETVEENLNILSCSKLWQVLPSFLHNYCHENKCCLQSIKSIFLITSKYFSGLEVTDDNLNVVENFINFLSGILQHDCKEDFFQDPEVSSCLIYLFEKFAYERSALPLVEIFQELFENEKLCKNYIDQKILNAVIKRTDGICKITNDVDEHSKEGFSEEVSTQSLDVLALISSHSSVLAEIQSDLTSIMTQWMTSPPTDHHLATAGIICGNICTSDAACLQLLSTNIPSLLISHVNTNSSAKVLHAVVGCLRNLAVCSSARDQLLELGLVETSSKMLISLSQGTDHTVTPKLLSTLRLVTQVWF